MRRFLALGSGAVYLALGFVAGAAHVHEAGDHHDEMRGLHIDHAHVGAATGRGHAHPHPHGSAPAHDAGTPVDADHVEHHEGDALCLTVTAQRSIDLGAGLSPAWIAVGRTIDDVVPVSVRLTREADRPRGPPGKGPTPPRAPPA